MEEFLKSGPSRTFSIKEDLPSGRVSFREVTFGDIKDGDVFRAFDDGEQVYHEDGAPSFLATSPPYMWHGVPCIDVVGVW